VDLNLHDPVGLGAQRELMGESVEKRKVVRFQLGAPVIFRWGSQASLGRTRDISIKGVYVICDTLPPVGTALSLEVVLPPLEGNTMQRLHLEARGKVIRVEAEEESSGFAATAPFGLHEMGASHRP
jgi:PilZ domain